MVGCKVLDFLAYGSISFVPEMWSVGWWDVRKIAGGLATWGHVRRSWLYVCYLKNIPTFSTL